ncbi:MAG: BON domain-containing protein [Microcoleus sp. PH2017_10_PVI_O_A]|uniref:BON domain-containing protein n=1 Tax=unclassified Microcoleus TaxID=2642155 RepID=UPI001D7AB525|nr:MULTISPECIES: BON domain-containing protein [unclassified Microcoleus]TAE84945.1 MAG: BON domain-containing protein [Oscillatoriales cyanobacterium]MCC3404324.1 BON domain-containing protein [Microcoleus sp. PH2017_10_PVI_O_A]MCC3458413.1 BON domain-containing protein [Microcoleus sp. PH2017_11_PCY_U_A]MCC3476751.1 BON domain-containing protein [Microcoleus sp. PH2017_12_PCY_D_A]MCC3526890.1 BON domain-containing protein [Microcoleus sp. PH2017_21_RUC_O_A]
MGWLKRLFGLEKLENQETVEAPAYQAPVAQSQAQAQPAAASTQTIPPERMGLNGEYDQSGLAKRVAQAFDANPDVADIETVYVAQHGSTVVLKGTVPSQEIVSTLVTIARGVNGATGVETNQVTVG